MARDEPAEPWDSAPLVGGDWDHLRFFEVKNGDTRAIPLRAWVDFEWHSRAVHVEIGFAQNESQPGIRELAIRASRADWPSITSETLRDFPIGDVLNRVVDLTAHQVTPTEDGGFIVDTSNQPRGRSDPQRASAYLIHRGRKPDAELQLEAEAVARFYNEAVRNENRAPIRFVFEQMQRDFPGLSRRTIQRRKELAVTLGLIEGES